MLLDIEFDFVSHDLVCRTSRGEIRKIPLRPTSVAQFFEEFTGALASSPIQVAPLYPARALRLLTKALG